MIFRICAGGAINVIALKTWVATVGCAYTAVPTFFSPPQVALKRAEHRSLSPAQFLFVFGIDGLKHAGR